MNNELEIINKIKELLEFPEERMWFEFKENWYDPNQLGEYISALANSATYNDENYGYFIWGINNDTHEIVGTKFNYHVEYQNSPLEMFLANNIKPDINFKFYEVFVNDKRIVVLKIPKASSFIVSFKHKRYFRIDSSKVDLENYPEREMELMEIIRHGYPTIENTEAKYQDLTFKELFGYYASKGIELKQINFKKNLGLLTNDGKYNLLAQLLSDDSHISIRFSIFKGKDKTSQLYSVREFGNRCILVSLDKLIDYGDTLNIIQADETNRKVERKDIPLFEPKAFFEATLNSIMHNKWTTGDGPSFTMFSDRLEILSRGVLPANQTVEGFYRGDSIPVNKSLARIVNQLHISETSGRGVPKIISYYGKDSILIRDNNILVTIPLRWINNVGDKVDDKMGDKIKVNKTQRKIIDEMRDNPNVTLPQLMIEIGLGRTAIQNNVTYLRKNGLIERVGSNKTGYWKVKVEQ